MNIETEQHLKDYFALKNTINIANRCVTKETSEGFKEYFKSSKFELLAKLTDNSKVISLDKEISGLAYEQITKEVTKQEGKKVNVKRKRREREAKEK